MTWPPERQRLMKAWLKAKAAHEAEGLPFVMGDPPPRVLP